MKEELNVKEFLDLTIEEIFADRFSRYSKYIIQDRALPDVRDGLKPVQRRILYSMHKEGNVFGKPFRKSAKTVGNVIGNYHPHGDTSVYDAMVRMSQTWKVNQQLVIMHGNNGSIDGDSAAAMRYTEAKMSQYAEVMMQDIYEDTVKMAPNFDDTELEPTVLPTKIPNLLINGATGISAGYATDIPPHNPEEVIKAAIYVNENPDCTLDEIMEIVPAPDFPTGAIIQGVDGIRQAYETGKGKIVIRADYKIVKNDIIISSIPYEVNKSTLLQRMEIIRIDKKVDGIVEIVDHSDQHGLEIVVSCRRDANKELILKYLLKHTDLQRNYNFNIIAINNRHPEQLGIKTILTSFIAHREEVITRRSNYRLEKAQAKVHVLEGMIKAISMLDKVIEIIRGSKNKADSKQNLMDAFDFSDRQAEAIVMMQLYRLSNTDMENLLENMQELKEEIAILESILGNKRVLKKLISTELKEVLAMIDTPRKSKIETEIEKIEIDKNDLIKEERAIVSISKFGYIKRSNARSYLASSILSTRMEEDIIVDNVLSNTRDKLLIFFNDGTYVIMPVFEIPETKWKDIGKHISSFAKTNDGVEVIGAINTRDFKNFDSLVTVSEKGYVSHAKFADLNATRLKSKIVWQKLKPNDKVASVTGLNLISTEELVSQLVVFVTDKNRYTALPIDNFEPGSLKRVGKKCGTLKDDEKVMKVLDAKSGLLIFTDKGGYCKVNGTDFIETRRFSDVYKDFKTNPHTIVNVFDGNVEELVLINDKEQLLPTNELKAAKPGDKLKIHEKDMLITQVERVIDLGSK